MTTTEATDLAPSPRTCRYGDPLTLAELVVLERVAAGRGNTDTGRDLYLSTDTVKSHMRRMFAKLGAYDRSHLVALAFVRGYLWVGLDSQVHAGFPDTLRTAA
jgi:DNA-binding CsgD family transcriptional regulator